MGNSPDVHFAALITCVILVGGGLLDMGRRTLKAVRHWQKNTSAQVTRLAELFGDWVDDVEDHLDDQDDNIQAVARRVAKVEQVSGVHPVEPPLPPIRRLRTRRRRFQVREINGDPEECA